MDYTFIEKLGKEPKYSSQKDEYQISLTPKTVGEIRGEADEILTNTVVIQFYPNSSELRKMITRTVEGKEVEQLYDPNVESVLEGIATLVAKFGLARVIIEGHTDSSMRGQVDEALVTQLSRNRANAVKEALLQKYKSLQPNQFSVDGLGWKRPFDPSDPLNHAKNRRVEIKVYSAEKQ
jgi:outer membrane protein OmpA-like peptidoglycan-associated protein